MVTPLAEGSATALVRQRWPAPVPGGLRAVGSSRDRRSRRRSRGHSWRSCTWGARRRAEVRGDSSTTLLMVRPSRAAAWRATSGRAGRSDEIPWPLGRSRSLSCAGGVRRPELLAPQRLREAGHEGSAGGRPAPPAHLAAAAETRTSTVTAGTTRRSSSEGKSRRSEYPGPTRTRGPDVAAPFGQTGHRSFEMADRRSSVVEASEARVSSGSGRGGGPQQVHRFFAVQAPAATMLRVGPVVQRHSHVYRDDRCRPRCRARPDHPRRRRRVAGGGPRDGRRRGRLSGPPARRRSARVVAGLPLDRAAHARRVGLRYGLAGEDVLHRGPERLAGDRGPAARP